MEIAQALLSLNPYSRPGRPMGKIRGLALHWIGKPLQRAASVRAYWSGRRDSYGSAHLIVDLDGRALQCIPLAEMAYHVGGDAYSELALKHYGSYPNAHLLGIEMCHLDWEGRYPEETWRGAVLLCAFLCREYGLTESNIVTHYAITGKECPRWFVRHPDELVRFLNEVEMAL